MTARNAGALPALLILLLAVACCPVPMAGSGETAFSATVESAEGGWAGSGPAAAQLVSARLSSGRPVRLALPAGTETPEVGALIWVEGTTSDENSRGEAVRVRSLRVIEQVASRPR